MTEHLINRPAHLTKCSHCDAVTITGITSGLTIAVNPEPLSIHEEIAAILAGKVTFSLHPVGHSIWLELRGVTEIRAGRPHPVAAIHQCRGARQLAVTVAATTGSLPDDPPF